MSKQRRERRFPVHAHLVAAFLTFATVISLGVHAGTTTYTYDAEGRLAAVTAPVGTDHSVATIIYDPGDNRTSITYSYQDLTPPNAPTGLSAVAQAYNWIQLTWTASTDSGGGPVSYYKIYRGGSFLTTSAGSPFNDNSVAANTPYTYNVSAVDPSSNESAQSGPASATTGPGPDLIAPSVPANLQGVAVSGTQVNLTWNGSTDTGGSGLAGYKIFRDNSGTPLNTSTVASYSDPAVAVSSTHLYTVAAYDNAGNQSGLSNQVSVTTPDTLAPAAPGNPTFSSITSSSAIANWTPASDNVGVTQYRYSLDGGISWTYQGNTTTATLSGLALGAHYTMLVEAGDQIPNWGPASSGSFTTIAYYTDNLSFVSGEYQQGFEYPNILDYEGYLPGVMGSLTPATTSNGKTIQYFMSTTDYSTGLTFTGLALPGLCSDPGVGWLVALTVAGNSSTLTGANTSSYHYTPGSGCTGAAIWGWPGYGPTLSSGTLTLVHY